MSNITKLTTNIVNAFLKNNKLAVGELTTFISSVGSALSQTTEPTQKAVQQKPRNYNATHKRCVAVEQFTIEGKFVARYPSQSIAAAETGISRNSIVLCCNEKRPSVHGFVFKKAA